MPSQEEPAEFVTETQFVCDVGLDVAGLVGEFRASEKVRRTLTSAAVVSFHVR